VSAQNINGQSQTCCSPGGTEAGNREVFAGARLDQSFVAGSLETPVGLIPRVTAALTREDRWATMKARWGVGRLDYRVDPGVYALNRPDGKSAVLVTANYKMTFDRLRNSLPGRDAWILVLDTDGVNVWCAAGKGTFGTGELIEKVRSCRLAELVSHRKLVLPQLGGPGVAGHLVKKLCGFRAGFGPIRAEDLPAYLDDGNKATAGMRKKSFTLRERAALVPMELVSSLRFGLLIGLVFFFTAGLGWPGDYMANLATHGLLAVTGLTAGLLAGAAATPLLLPRLPGRAFSAKGALAGVIAGLIHAAAWWPEGGGVPERLEIGGWLLMGPALAAFLAMNFTGASTFTSLSGVRKEMRLAVPLQIIGAASGLILWISARFAA